MSDTSDRPDDAEQVNQRRAAYRAVFNRGQNATIVLADLVAFCHGDRPSYVPGSQDETAYNEGKRRVLLRILGMVSDRGEVLGRIQKLTAENTDQMRNIVEGLERD